MVRLALVALAIIVLSLAAPAASADFTESGWTIRRDTPIIFVGDWLNVTLHGPFIPQVPYVYWNLTSSNGTIIDERHIFSVNGTTRYSYQTKLTIEAGQYSLRSAFNGTVVSITTITVVFDRENFNDKRLTILELQNAQQEKTIQAWRAENRDLKAQVNGFWWVPWSAGVFFFGLFLVAVLLAAPLARWLVSIKYPRNELKRLGWGALLLRLAATPPGVSEIDHIYDETSAWRPPPETDPFYLYAHRLDGMPDPVLRNDQRYVNPMIYATEPGPESDST